MCKTFNSFLQSKEFKYDSAVDKSVDDIEFYIENGYLQEKDNRKSQTFLKK